MTNFNDWFYMKNHKSAFYMGRGRPVCKECGNYRLCTCQTNLDEFI